MEHDELSVSVTVMGRRFTMKSSRANEAAIRRAADNLDKMIFRFQKSFGSRDMVDPVIMAALNVGTELEKMKENTAYKDHQLVNALEDIDSLLDEYLHPTQNSL